MDGLSAVGKHLDLDVGSRTVYNTIAPPTLPLLPQRLGTEYNLYVKSTITKLLFLFANINNEEESPSTSKHQCLSWSRSWPGLCQPIYSLAKSSTGPPSPGLHRYAKMPTAHAILLSIASSVGWGKTAVISLKQAWRCCWTTTTKKNKKVKRCFAVNDKNMQFSFGSAHIA